MRSRPADISWLLLAAFAITIAAATLLLYADRNLFDSGRFADRAAVALDDPAVRQQISDELTQAIVRSNPDAIAIEPVIQGIASGVVGSAPFRALVRGAAFQSHAAVFGGERDALVLALADGVLLVAQALRRLDPGAAARIPQDVTVSLVSLSEATGGGVLTDVARAAERAGSLGWLALAVALACAALAIALAADRRRAARNAGLSLAATGALLAVGLTVARSVVAVQAPGDEDALRAIWDVLLGDLLTLQISLVLTGLVLASVAESVLRPVGLPGRLRALATLAARRPQRPWLRALRAAGLVLAGTLILLDPLGALRLAGIALGLLVLTSGVDELLRVSARDRPATAAPTGGQRGPGRRRAAVAAALVAAALATPVLVTAGAEGPAPAVAADERCNGARELCERRIDEIALPATHNAESAPQAGFLFPNQDSPIAAQLEGGIRALLIDTHMGIRTARGVFTVLAEGGKSRGKIEQTIGPEATATAERLRDRIGTPTGAARPWLCHGFCELGAIDAVATLAAIDAFLVAHPREVLVIVIEDQITPEQTTGLFADSGLLGRVWKGAIAPLPTLAAMIERDERVLVFGEEETAGPSWYHQLFDHAVETPFDSPTQAALLGPRGCGPNRGSPGAPLGLLNHWVARTPPRPRDAERVNDADVIARHARGCAQALGGEANLLAVDFWGRGDVVAAAAQLNGVPAAR